MHNAGDKKYKPSANSLGSGQVLQCPYPYEKALLVVREMADQLALELVDKELVTDQVVLTVGYDIENLRNPSIRGRYHGEVKRSLWQAGTEACTWESQPADSNFLCEGDS